MNGMKRLVCSLIVFAAAATALAANQESFKFATWNIGHFAHGSSATPTAAYSNPDTWNAAIDELGADIISFQEYHPTMSGGANTAVTIGGDYVEHYDTGVSAYTCNALWCKSGTGEIVDEPYTKVYTAQEGDGSNKRNFLDITRLIGGKTVHFISTQLSWLQSDANVAALNCRQSQIQELYNYCKDFDYAVLSGDFNSCFGVDELNVFMENGWECVNENPCLPTCSAFAIDNILLKGLTASEVGRYDVEMELSDHMALYCTLRFGKAADYQAVIDETLFRRRQAITFPGYKGTTTLRNFPALVRVSGLNENNFRFTDEEGHLLAFDVDELNAEGESIVWVRIPEFNAETKIYLYYSPTEAAILPVVDSASVWTDYAGVWHMNEDETVGDASGNNLVATPASGVSSSVTSDGVIGSAVEKTGSLEVDNVYALTGDDKFNYANFTASGWYKWSTPIDSTLNPTVIGKGGWGTGGWYVQHKDGNAEAVTLVINRAVEGLQVGSFPSANENWNYVAVVAETNSFALYMNGKEVYRSNNKLASSTTDKFVIGSWPGLADETRLMRRGRSADFIAADYAQVVDDEFAVFGAVEALDGTILVNSPAKPADVVFNGLCQRPSLEGEGYTVDYGEGDYLAPGTYTITLSLDEEDSVWESESAEDLVYTLVIKPLDLTVTLGAPVTEGGVVAGYELNFTALSTPSAVYAVWGDEDWGDRAADWAQVELVENYVAAGATSATVPVPAGWGKAAKFLRYILVPSGIRQLEYITANGNQWVDTDYRPTAYVKASVKVCPSAKTSQIRAFACGEANSPTISTSLCFEQYINGNGYWSYAFTGGVNGNWVSENQTVTVNADYELTMDGKEKKWWVNGTSGAMTLGLASGVTQPKLRAINAFWFFWTPREENVAFSGKIYSAALWDYDTEIGAQVDTANDEYKQLLDLLPVEFAGKVGLWDNVEKKFYPSAGSGDFVAGPESGEETLVLPDLPMFATSGLSPIVEYDPRPLIFASFGSCSENSITIDWTVGSLGFKEDGSEGEEAKVTAYYGLSPEALESSQILAAAAGKGAAQSTIDSLAADTVYYLKLRIENSAGTNESAFSAFTLAGGGLEARAMKLIGKVTSGSGVESLKVFVGPGAQGDANYLGVAYGAIPGGDTLADWEVVEPVATLTEAAGEYTWPLPEGWGETVFFARLFLGDSTFERAYRGVEYLKLNGQGYISTGIDLTSNNRVDVDWQWDDKTTPQQVLCYAGKVISSASLILDIYINGSAQFAMMMGAHKSGDYDTKANTITLDYNRHTYGCDLTSGKFIYDGVEKRTFSESMSGTANNLRIGWNEANEKARGRLYGVKIYAAGDEAYELMPIKLSSGEGALVDRRSGTVYPATGLMEFGAETGIDAPIEVTVISSSPLYSEVSAAPIAAVTSVATNNDCSTTIDWVFVSPGMDATSATATLKWGESAEKLSHSLSLGKGLADPAYYNFTTMVFPAGATVYAKLVANNNLGLRGEGEVFAFETAPRETEDGGGEGRTMTINAIELAKGVEAEIEFGEATGVDYWLYVGYAAGAGGKELDNWTFTYLGLVTDETNSWHYAAKPDGWGTETNAVRFVLSEAKGSVARSYSSSGLMHLYDAKENNGWGQFSTSPGTWKDLVGDKHLAQSSGTYGNGTVTYSEQGVQLSANNARSFLAVRAPDILTQIKNKSFTMEAALNTGAFSKFGGILDVGDVGNGTENKQRVLHVVQDTDAGVGGIESALTRFYYMTSGYVAEYHCVKLNNRYENTNVTVTVTVDSEGAHLYIDGELKATCPSNGLDATADQFSLGNYSKDGVTKAKYMSVRCYDHALSTEEMAHNRKLDRGHYFGFEEPEPVAPDPIPSTAEYWSDTLYSQPRQRRGTILIIK